MSLHPEDDNRRASQPLVADPIRRALQENEDWYRDLVEHSQDLLCIHDLQGRLLSVNPAPARVLGYTVEELLNVPMREIIAPEFRPQFDAYLMQVERVGEARGMMAVMTRSGERRIWEYHNTLRTEGVAAPIVRGLAHDVTERKRAERQAREAGELNRQIIASVNEGLIVYDRNLRCIAWNSFIEKLTGIPASQALGKRFDELTASVGGDGATAAATFDRLLAGEVLTPFDRLMVDARDEKHWVCVCTSALRNAQGEITGFLATVQDVDKRHQAEATLRESEARERAKARELETVLDAMPVPVFLASDPSCRRITANRAGWEHLRVPEGTNFSKSAPPQEQPPFRVLRDGKELQPDELPMQVAAATGKRVDGIPLTLAFNEGASMETILNAAPLFDENGNVKGVIGASIDITERKRAEDALRRSEENYRNFVSQSSEGIFCQDLDTPLPLDMPEEELVQRILHDSYMAQCNDAMARMYGLPSPREFLGKRLTEILVVDDPLNIQLTRDYIRSGFRVVDRESHEVDLHGNPKVFLNSMIGIVENGKLMRTWGIQRDITEKVKLEKAREQAEEALRQSDERFRVALTGSPIRVFNQDKDLRYTWAYNVSDGWTEQDHLGKTDEEVFESADAAGLTALKRQVISSGVGGRQEMTISARGRTCYYDVAVEPLRDVSGNIVGVTSACTDVTYLRDIMEQLRQAKDRLTEEKLYLEQAIDAELGFGEIVGQSAALKSVTQHVIKVAASDAAALLLGETGTGKELFAREIHSRSRRSQKSFIKMNCAAIPSGLLESELFGHEKGAFTGAFARKIGRLELADHGTIFLDEIGEIPLELQPKLLRVLQDQEFERLGGTQTIKVDFRLIAATNRDLVRAVREKQFRSDLYYRLNVFPIRVPALRDRRDDIPLLIEHFVAKCAARMNKSITSIPKSTMDVLMRWDWPGNIRELENFVERSVILTQGSVLQSPLAELVHSR